MDANQAEQEISLIKKIMVDSRSAVYDSSIQGLFWTLVMTPAILINYFIIIFNFGYHFVGFLWIAAIAIGTAGSIIIAHKEKRTVRVKTFAGNLLAVIGLAVGGANVIFSFASAVAGAFDPLYLVPVNSVALGLAFYVISYIQQLKSLKIISYIWWAGAIFFFIFPSIHCLLFLAILLVITVWLPKMEEKNNQKSNNQKLF